MRHSHKKIGLVLGSGGARGWAHIGALHAVQEMGLPIHCVAGTSMGAAVGATYVSGRLDDLHHVALSLNWQRLLFYFTDLSFPRAGLIDGSRIVALVAEHVTAVDIQDLPIRFAAVATDIRAGAEVVFTEGSVLDAVRASIAIPGVFTPLMKDGAVLVDGGLVNPLPVSVARAMGADFVIAVDVTEEPGLPPAHGRKTPSAPQTTDWPHAAQPALSEALAKWLERVNRMFRAVNRSAPKSRAKRPGPDALPSIFDIYANVIRIVERQILAMRLKLEPPDLLIRPDIRDVGTMDFHKAREAIRAGYDAAKVQLCEAAKHGPLRKYLPGR
jgi:NTE family protein